MKTVEQLAREAWPEAWRYDTNDDFVTFTFEELQRFHDAAIAQYRESLLAGVGEADYYYWNSDNYPSHWDSCDKSHYWHVLNKQGSDDVMTCHTADQMAAAVAIERERLASLDWTTTLREGALVTWGDAETLGDRVAAAIRSGK